MTTLPLANPRTADAFGPDVNRRARGFAGLLWHKRERIRVRIDDGTSWGVASYRDPDLDCDEDANQMTKR